jgi:NAD(P)-dependent dehydrogenase (short-subunit alcohol dehydrogenase family)
MDVTMNGRTALITGGSKGIGLAIATRMAASGANVALLARRADVLEQARQTVQDASKATVHVVACDVSQADEVTGAYEDVMRVFGQIDVLVNNAGTSRTGPFTSITDEVWQADLDLKLFAPGWFGRRWWSGGGDGSSTC